MLTQAVDAFDMDAEVEERAGAAVFQKLHPEEYYASFLKEGLRPDGRGLHDTRPLTISLGMLRTPTAAREERVMRLSDGPGLARRRPAQRTMPRPSSRMRHL